MFWLDMEVRFYKTCLYDIDALCNIHPWCCILSYVFGTSCCACGQERQFSLQMDRIIHNRNHFAPVECLQQLAAPVQDQRIASE